MAKNTANTIFG